MPRNITHGPTVKELQTALFNRSKGAKRVIFKDGDGVELHCTVDSVEAPTLDRDWKIAGYQGMDVRYEATYSTKTRKGSMTESAR